MVDHSSWLPLERWLNRWRLRWQVELNVGFTEHPAIPRLLQDVRLDPEPDFDHATSFLAEDLLTWGRDRGLARWPVWLYTIMSRSGVDVAGYYSLPHDRVVALPQRLVI